MVLLGRNINGKLNMGSLLEKSDDSIKKAFTFKEKFYVYANYVLLKAQQSFSNENGNLHAISTENETKKRYPPDASCNQYFLQPFEIGTKDEKSACNYNYQKTGHTFFGSKTPVNTDTMFIGVHVR